MTGINAIRILELIIALVIVAAVLVFSRKKKGKVWWAILLDPNRSTRYVEIATFIILLVIFAVFFVINNDLHR